jgi:hypothetical protein
MALEDIPGCRENRKILDKTKHMFYIMGVFIIPKNREILI